MPFQWRKEDNKNKPSLETNNRKLNFLAQKTLDLINFTTGFLFLVFSI